MLYKGFRYLTNETKQVRVFIGGDVAFHFYVDNFIDIDNKFKNAVDRYLEMCECVDK